MRSSFVQQHQRHPAVTPRSCGPRTPASPSCPHHAPACDADPTSGADRPIPPRASPPRWHRGSDPAVLSERLGAGALVVVRQRCSNSSAARHPLPARPPRTRSSWHTAWPSPTSTWPCRVRQGYTAFDSSAGCVTRNPGRSGPVSAGAAHSAPTPCAAASNEPSVAMIDGCA